MSDSNSEKQETSESPSHQLERLLFALEHIGDGVIVTNSIGEVDYLNPMAEKLTGWSASEARQRPVSEIFPVFDATSRDGVLCPIALCLSRKRKIEAAGHVQLQRCDGRVFSIHYTAVPMLDAVGELVGCSLIFHDDSKLRGIEREMAYQASHDSLTGLINRWEFGSHVVRTLIAARRHDQHHAFFYLDLDQFKVVNDTCGHVAGDELLKQIANTLESHLEGRGVIARLGGDEFGILVEDCELAQACEFAESLRRHVADSRFRWKDRGYDLSVSIGLVPISRVSGSLAEVLSAADSACYVAKDLGRNRVHLYQSDDEALVQRHGEMEWTHHIRKALDENRFRLYRQSIEPVQEKGKQSHYEVLIRMEDERGNIILPSEFIGAAERYNLMPAIDRWVITNVFDYVALHGSENVIYAINLSGQSISDEKFLDFIVEQYDRTNVDPSNICFEITETAAVESLSQAANFISILKGMGYSFALDDFGSGLSSFAYLKELKVDLLKIDGGFVRDMANDPIHHAMVESINHVGHVMGMKTVAEFVEQDETCRALHSIGVDYMQGFGISRPALFV